MRGETFTEIRWRTCTLCSKVYRTYGDPNYFANEAQSGQSSADGGSQCEGCLRGFFNAVRAQVCFLAHNFFLPV